MKIIKYFAILLGVLFLFSGCSSSSSYLKDLSYSDLNKKIESKEEFFFVATQDGCSHCESYIPTLTKVLNDNKVVGYNFNLTKLSEEEREKFDELFKIDGTPTTIFMKDGEEVSLLQRIYGNAEESQILVKLKNNNYIK